MIAVPQTPLDRWLPKLVLCLRQYNLGFFSADVIAGVTVGLVALPLAMAFGIASGVTPQAGIYTAVIAGFVISALGGSRTQIGGPTGAFVVIVAGIVAKFGLSGLFMVTMMAGIMLVVMGTTGLGTAVKFIPRPVTIGFTNGIAVLIASTQIRDFLGLKTQALPSEFIGRMNVLFSHLDTIDPRTCVGGLLFAGDYCFVAGHHETGSGVDHRASGGDFGRCNLSSPRRHDWLKVRRNSQRTSFAPHAHVPR